ncbi:MAG: hypothetical protein RI893_1698, partial [Pseudomonadota bacterium]
MELKARMQGFGSSKAETDIEDSATNQPTEKIEDTFAP